MQNQRAAQYLREYEHDRNSVFVSNLPEGFTESDFRMLFNPFGVVVSAVLFQRPSQRNGKFPVRAPWTRLTMRQLIKCIYTALLSIRIHLLLGEQLKPRYLV